MKDSTADARASGAAKDDRIYLRTTAAQKSLILAAAAANNRSLSDFLLEAAMKEASSTLLDQRIFFASETEFAAFEAALDRPARQSERLDELVTKKAPWE